MKYIFPVIAVVALVLGILGAVPNEMLGGQYSTNHAYFAGITNQGTLTQTGDLTLTGALTATGVLTNTGAVSIVGDVNADKSNTTTTLALGNTGVGKICLYNGSNYTVMEYAANTTTMTVATSTACN